MAASYNLLHLPFPKTLTLTSRPLSSPHRSISLSSSGSRRRPLLLSAAAAISPAINPSLAHANILYFKSGYNVQIVVEEGEPEEVLVRRFRREVSKAGVIQECKRRRFFENKHDEKKRKKREAGRRNRMRRLGPRFNSSSPQAAAAATKKSWGDDDDDNWDLPEGNLP